MNLFDTHSGDIFLQSFGSSSSGNCTAIWDEDTLILVDCGFSASYIRAALKQIHKTVEQVTAVLITHIHSDHVHHSAVNQFIRSNRPIHCHNNIHESLCKKYGSMLDEDYEKSLNTFLDSGLQIGALSIQPFALPHDSEGGCYGFSIEKQRGLGPLKLTIATDLSHTRNGMNKHFTDADFILIEANYDPQMLENSGRPHYLKKRIRDDGHLSNEECASFLVDVLKKSKTLPSVIMLGHISAQCNTNALAMQCVKNALTANNFGHIRLVETYRNMPGERIEL
ncbi:MAG: MBL fold metallo-hydrolase [Ignavibacteriales bacterium]|nr:MBL fold metallo-hydrolase [Ignavibacteriales bacterium]